MFLAPFFNQQEQSIRVSAEQASAFAKQVASDFNPIHDVDAKRFCVPGDLLFALVLNQYGLSQTMNFTFEGMVGNGIELIFPDQVENVFDINDSKDKHYLTVAKSGDVSRNEKQIEAFVRSYVAFSGLNFTHVLVPLMEQHQLMINPARPLVIYESMAFDIEHFDFESLELKLVDSQLVVDGKRGDVTLSFELLGNGKRVGTGTKKLVMSGLRTFEQEAVDGMCQLYQQRQQQFAA